MIRKNSKHRRQQSRFVSTIFPYCVPFLFGFNPIFPLFLILSCGWFPESARAREQQFIIQYPGFGGIISIQSMGFTWNVITQLMWFWYCRSSFRNQGHGQMWIVGDQKNRPKFVALQVTVSSYMVFIHVHMVVSRNTGTQKWMIYTKPIENRWLGGTPMTQETSILRKLVTNKSLVLWAFRAATSEARSASASCLGSMILVMIWDTVNLWYIVPSHQFLKSALSWFRIWHISNSG